jgi:hypothetical protein
MTGGGGGMDVTFKAEHYKLLDGDIASCYELKFVGRKVLVAIF